MHNNLNQQSNVAIVHQSLDEIHTLLSALEAQSKSGSLEQRERGTAEALPPDSRLQERGHCFTPAVLEDASVWIDEFNAFGEP